MNAPEPVLAGRKALVVGIANDHSIAYGCARAFREAGADLAVSWLNDKARPHVEPLARALEASITGAMDVAMPGELEALFDQVRQKWGRLDILVHSIAYAPLEDLRGGLLDCSAGGFAQAMDISCHSFIRMARLAAPLMTDGGTMFAMSYYGANRVVPNYNVMGPVKAALEASCRYLAYELGPKRIRVHAISPGPLKTRMDLRLPRDPLRPPRHRRHRLCRRRPQHHRLNDRLHRRPERRLVQHQVCRL